MELAVCSESVCSEAGKAEAPEKVYQYLNEEGYCDRMISGIYTEQQPVIWAENAVDLGGFYEMEACVDHGLEDNGYLGESFFTVIRVRKDAVVSYMGEEMSLEEYQNYRPDRSGRPFASARMLRFSQDEDGYITWFMDMNAG
ncbi:hypothetical protein [Enterocloster lavalensis]|uniref:hypothetical protein n=1 Tax=Enterocloster lavalensis TaxID=460384 RepID=UPI002A7FEB12|nr:hypothetical protein [Enterocloster lavalensis]